MTDLGSPCSLEAYGRLIEVARVRILRLIGDDLIAVANQPGADRSLDLGSVVSNEDSEIGVARVAQKRRVIHEARSPCGCRWCCGSATLPLTDRFERFRRGLGFNFATSTCQPSERGEDNGLASFEDVANWVLTAVPGLDRATVIERFRLDVRHNAFGRRRNKIGQLLDLAGVTSKPDPPSKGGYSLRPSELRARAFPDGMLSRRDIWAEFLERQGWLLPGWLPRSKLIKGESEGGLLAYSPRIDAGASTTDPPAERAPRASRRGNTGYKDEVVKRAQEIYREMEKRSKRKAAENAIDEEIAAGKKVRDHSSSKEAWTDRISRKI